MAYDEALADRVREYVAPEKGITEKRMFGGLAFLINGHMAVSVGSKGGLLLRVDPVDTEDLVRRPNAKRFEMRGREMNGWLHIDADGGMSDDVLEQWVKRGLTYAKSLPPKSS